MIRRDIAALGQAPPDPGLNCVSLFDRGSRFFVPQSTEQDDGGGVKERRRRPAAPARSVLDAAAVILPPCRSEAP